MRWVLESLRQKGSYGAAFAHGLSKADLGNFFGASGPDQAAAPVSEQEPIQTYRPSDSNQHQPPALKGFGYLYKRGRFWWIRYSVRGKDFRESSKSEREINAMRLLTRRWQEVGKGRFIGPSEERVLVDDLFQPEFPF